MTEPWWQGRMLAVDLETTCPDPEEARIVTATVVAVGGGEPTDEVSLIVDPQVEIPEEATAIHGVSTEKARAEGVHPQQALGTIMGALAPAAGGVLPLIAANARFDLTVIDRELRRWGMPDLFERLPFVVVDPFVIDKRLDRYRKSYPNGHTPESAKAAGIPSSRTLEGMCRHYRVTLDGAHDAAFDAIAAARLVYRLASSGQVIRRVRTGADVAEKQELEREWAEVRVDVVKLHEAQTRWALEERARFAEYKRSNGEPDVAAQVEAEVGWPVLEPRAVTA